MAHQALMSRGTRVAAAVCCSFWILLMTSLKTGRRLVLRVTRSRASPVSRGSFRRSSWHRQPRCGIGAPARLQGGHEVCASTTNSTNFIAASICTQGACTCTFSISKDKRASSKICPRAPRRSFRSSIAPFRNGLVVGCECMFAWYWLADLCEDESIPFTLGHALYMKAIHGGKAKNDKIDAAKIAGLLRGGMFPMAFVYPRDMRETRDLLRRRTFFVRQKAQLIAHIQNTNSQYNLPPFERKLSRQPDYSELAE